MDIEKWVCWVSARDLSHSILFKLNSLSKVEREMAIKALVERGNKEPEIGRVMEHALFKCLYACYSFGRKEETKRGTKALLASLAKRDSKVRPIKIGKSHEGYLVLSRRDDKP